MIKHKEKLVYKTFKFSSNKIIFYTMRLLLKQDTMFNKVLKILYMVKKINRNIFKKFKNCFEALFKQFCNFANKTYLTKKLRLL